MSTNFVPTDFNVPTSYIKDKYCLEVLSAKFAELDFDAVSKSKKRLRNVFGESTEWPKEDITLEDNIRDLNRHEQEFLSREAFAYSILTPNIDKCLGCLYIEPSASEEYDCEVYLWVRESEIELDEKLYKDVKDWLKERWPFKNVIFPGREISWEEWKYIRPDK